MKILSDYRRYIANHAQKHGLQHYQVRSQSEYIYPNKTIRKRYIKVYLYMETMQEYNYICDVINKGLFLIDSEQKHKGVTIIYILNSTY